MKKHILLALCTIATVWGADVDPDPVTHEAYKERIERHSTPRRMADDFNRYNEFAKQNQSGASRGPKADYVLKSFKERVGNSAVPLDVLADTLNKGIEFQKEHPNASCEDGGKFGSVQVGQVLKAFDSALSAATNPNEKLALLNEGMALQAKYLNVSYGCGAKFYSGHVGQVLGAYKEALGQEKDIAKKTQYFVDAMDLQTKYPSAEYGSGWSKGKFDANQAPQIHAELQAAFQKPMSSEEIVKMYNVWTAFDGKFPSKDAAYSPNFTRWKDKYDQAVADLQSKGALVPTSDAVQSTSDAARATAGAVASVRSVASMVTKYGTMAFGDTSSLEQFKADFTAIYRTAALRLHPDQNPSDGVKMQALNDDKAWVDSLTEATFQQATGH